MGAEKLLGKGDMLFLQPGTSMLVRAQGRYASDQEIARVVEHLECDPRYAEELMEFVVVAAARAVSRRLRERDELYEQAIEVVVREGRGSISLLQRSLGIGYGRAARLIDFMAEDGIVGPYNGSSRPRGLYKARGLGTAQGSGASGKCVEDPQRSGCAVRRGPRTRAGTGALNPGRASALGTHYIAAQIPRRARGESRWRFGPLRPCQDHSSKSSSICSRAPVPISRVAST